jgi:hypothetical protein
MSSQGNKTIEQIYWKQALPGGRFALRKMLQLFNILHAPDFKNDTTQALNVVILHIILLSVF